MNIKKMKLLKEYRIVFLIILVTITAVLIKSFNRNTFRYDAVKRAVPSVTKANILTSEQLHRVPGKILWIDLDTSENNVNEPDNTAIKIPADSILTNPYKKLILKHKGSIVLKSEELNKSAGVWMILSQMGLKNVFIFQE